ncbi:MAG: hypothetical protein DCF15_01820 [Phormidesmis priestleyi]|uniref:PPM-type phosphatase domain-containing protein n=1 Tax=Phormidesmis priestleyi TaxID=268141 RepID=A0A2W4XWA3_9CYAN|nr:MAG: hypothetical protein DCF15_01820 [Phormidesmis priestleyi]
MLTCPYCQFVNPSDHKFCQRCGKPLGAAAASSRLVTEPASKSAAEPATESAILQPLQATLLPPDKLALSPATYLSSNDPADRYQILTVLAQGSALIADTMPEVRSPLQAQLSQLIAAPLESFQSNLELPAAAYPYLLLAQAAPALYDAWQQGKTAILITPSEQLSTTSLISAFSTAIDPLQHVYWMYTLTDLWMALSPIPQWRSSLLLANNLGIGRDQSLCIRQFIQPGIQPPRLSDLKAFLQSLLAQPHRGAVAPLRQIRQTILTVTSAETLEQLRSELAVIGESLLATPEAITPAVSAAQPSAIAAPFTLLPAPLSASAPALEPQPHLDSVDDEPLDNNPLDPTANSASDPDLNNPLDPPAIEALLEDDLDDDSDSDIDLPELSESDESTMVLPMKLVRLEEAGRTHVGRQRDHNEDCFFIASSLQKQADNNGQRTQAHCLYVLCDGMGGHDGGEVASQLATQTLLSYFEAHWPHPVPQLSGNVPARSLPDEATIVEAVKLANKAIYDVNEAEERAGHERMGTTLVMVLLQGTEAVVAHVGDSRLYQHTRRMGLRQVTIDHEVGQREMKRGIPPEIAYGRPDAYQLTQALGPRGSEDLVPSVSYLMFSEDSLLLLCSDGLSDTSLVETYLDSHIDPVLRGKKDLETGMDDLITLANQVNGHDNISAIAIRLSISPDMAMMQLAAPAASQGQTIIQ